HDQATAVAEPQKPANGGPLFRPDRSRFAAINRNFHDRRITRATCIEHPGGDSLCVRRPRRSGSREAIWLFEYGDAPWFTGAVSVCDHQRHVVLILPDECELLAVGRKTDCTEDPIEHFCRTATKHRNTI